MQTTQAEAAVMLQTATKFDTVNSSLQSTLKRLLSELEVLRTQWQGAGGRSFEQVKQEWADDQTALNQALTATAENMRTAAGQYTTSDANAAGRMKPSATVSLPLKGAN
jgi:WXG100 family type VII secretion target